MAINKKLIHFQTLANFEAQLSAGNILDTSICFIKDANKIWTHGQFYDCDVQIMNDGGDGRVVLGHNNQTIYPYTLASQVQAGTSDLDTYLNNLATVATSGSYNDLKNKPTIPSAVTESTVSGWGFTKNTGTYSKPSTGIPKTDLASAVQTSLGKADTALQSYTEQYKGTITGVSANGTSVATSGVANIPAASTSKYGVTKLNSATNSTSTTEAATPSAVKAAYDLANSYKGTVTGVKINGTTKNPSSGIVDLGTVITAHQTLKTINGESIVGSGDITISSGSSDANVQAVATGDVIDDVAVEYVTKTYFDSVVGDINSVLESIINGGITLIAFTVGVNIYQAEEGMTWEQFVSSKYNNGDITITTPYVVYSQQAIALNGSMVEPTDIIISNTRYGLIV